MFTGAFVDSFSVEPYFETSQTQLEWSAAGGSSVNSSPNVRTDAAFDVTSRNVGLDATYLNKLNNSIALYLEGRLGKSISVDGDFDQREYAGDNLSQQVATYSGSMGGDEADVLGYAIGLKFRWFTRKDHYFTVLWGQDESNLNLSINGPLAANPVSASFGSSDSVYNTNRVTDYFALLSEHVFRFGTIGVRYERHTNVQFSATADWNHQDGYAHPASFTQSADGHGHKWTLGYSYPINPTWDLFSTYSQSTVSTAHGFQNEFLADGSARVVRLNGVDLDTNNLQAGFRFIW